MVTARILINHVEADEPVYQMGIRYKVITPNDSKDVVYFKTYKEAIIWVEAMGVSHAQGTLF